MAMTPVLTTPQTNECIEELLERLNTQIYEMARSKIPRAVVPQDVLDLEVDELAQRIRIKLWQALRSGHVHNVKAYLRCIVATECVDMVRRNRKALPLLFSEDGEIYQGNIMITASEGMQDPAEEYEQQEALRACVRRAAHDLLNLPTLQRKAMLCALKDRSNDTMPLIEVFTSMGIDVENIHWAGNQKQDKSLRSSLSIARKKLRSNRAEA